MELLISLGFHGFDLCAVPVLIRGLNSAWYGWGAISRYVLKLTYFSYYRKLVKMKIIEMIEKRRKILAKFGDSYGNLKCDKCPYVVRAIEPSLAAENKKEYQLRNNQRFFAFK